MRFTDKEISLEAARLLGVPFTYGARKYIYRYVHTAQGPKLLEMRITPQFVQFYGLVWFKAGDIFTEGLVVREFPLSVVELDEQEAADASDR